MWAEVRTLLRDFGCMVERYDFVGSRVTCNPPPTDTDCDILILTPSLTDFCQTAIDYGWEHGGSFSSSDDWMSLRKDEFNLIVTGEIEFWDYFIAATHEAKRLNLMQKRERVALFDSMIPAKYQSYKKQSQERPASDRTRIHERRQP